MANNFSESAVEAAALRDALLPKLLSGKLRLPAAVNVRLREIAEDRIRSRFEQSNSASLPLKMQITFIDAPNDQIVYRLYGLERCTIACLSILGICRPCCSN